MKTEREWLEGGSEREYWEGLTECQHDSAHGPSGPYGNEWECDGCGYRWRDVPDPDGPCISTRLGRFRKVPMLTLVSDDPQPEYRS